MAVICEETSEIRMWEDEIEAAVREYTINADANSDCRASSVLGIVVRSEPVMSGCCPVWHTLMGCTQEGQSVCGATVTNKGSTSQ